MKYPNDNSLWVKCPLCNKKVHQGVGYYHLKQEHPIIAKNLEKAMKWKKIDLK